MATQTVMIQSPRDLFLYDLCVMYDVELKLVQMLPVMAQECLDAQARDAFTQHEQETRQHIRNLEQCFQMLGNSPSSLENHTIAGLKQDHDTFFQQRPPVEALTLFDLHAGYQSECLEIAAYHNLIDEAASLGLPDCVQLFQQNLQQEVNTSKKLSEIAHQFEQQQVQIVQRLAANAAQQNQPDAGSNLQAPNQSYVAANPQAPNQPYPVANQQAPDQSSGTANQQMSRASQVQAGMRVLGSDMSNVGNVKDVRDNDFLVDIPMQRDVYVPFSAVQNVDENGVVLNIPSDQVKDMNWPNPPVM